MQQTRRRKLLPDPKVVKFINACGDGDIRTVRQIITSSFDVDSDIDGVTGLMKAAAGGHISIMTHLLRCGAVVEWKGPSDDPHCPFFWAAKNGQIEAVKFFEEEQQSNFFKMVTEFQGKGKKKSVLDYILQCIDSEIFCNTTENKYKVLEYLKQKGATFGTAFKDKNAVLRAARRGDTKFFSYCLEENSRIIQSLRTKDGGTLLHAACAADKNEIVKILLDNRAKKNEKRNDGFTPSHIAAFSGSCSTLSLLIYSGCDLWATDDIGRTPLHYCVEADHFDCAVCVMESISLKDDYMSVIKYLNIEDDENNTPLSLAFKGSTLKFRFVRYFLQFLFQISAVDDEASSRELSFQTAHLTYPNTSEMDIDAQYVTDFSTKRMHSFLCEVRPYLWGFSLSNVYIVSLEAFREAGKILPFSKACAEKLLIPLCDAKKDGTLLFISCKNDELENGSNNTMFHSLVLRYVDSLAAVAETNEISPKSNNDPVHFSSLSISNDPSIKRIPLKRTIDYIWINYSCVPSPNDIRQHEEQLRAVAARDDYRLPSYDHWNQRIWTESVARNSKIIALFRSSHFLVVPGLQMFSESSIAMFKDALHVTTKGKGGLSKKGKDMVVPNFQLFEDVDVQADSALAAMCGLEVVLGIRWSDKCAFSPVLLNADEYGCVGFKASALSSVAKIALDITDTANRNPWTKATRQLSLRRISNEEQLILKNAIECLYGDEYDATNALGIRMEFVQSLVNLILSMQNDGTLFDFLDMDSHLFNLGFIDKISPVSLSLLKVSILSLGRDRRESEKQRIISSYIAAFSFLMGGLNGSKKKEEQKVPVTVEMKSCQLQLITMESRMREEAARHSEELYAFESSIRTVLTKAKAKVRGTGALKNSRSFQSSDFSADQKKNNIERKESQCIIF